MRAPVAHSTRLRDWRIAAGLSLDEVAGLSGFSTAMLSRAERGQRDFSPLAKVRLARALAVSVATLFEPSEAEPAA